MNEVNTEQTQRYTLSEAELFKRLVQLETDKLTLAAVLHAKSKFEEQKEATDAVYQKYIELTDYQ